jgi:hypothetical protein
MMPPLPPIRAPRIEWPTAIVLCALFAALFGVWALSSPEQRADLLTGVAAVGGVVLSLMRALLSAQQQRPPAPPPPPHANGSDPDPLEELDESHLQRTIAPVVAVVLAGALAGCGPSALATHARVYAFAAVTLEASQASLVAACTSARDACAGEASCLADAESECRAAALAQDATRDAVATYEGVIRAAALADSGDVMGSLMVALSLAASAWASLGARLADVGLSLPALPAWVSGAIGGAQ